MSNRRIYAAGAVLILAAFFAPILVRMLVVTPAGKYEGYAAPTPILGRVEAMEQPIPLPPPDLNSGSGMVLIDTAHANDFFPEELAELVAKINDRGHYVRYLTSPSALADQLRGADSFVVVAARQSFMPDEIRALERFVARGGQIMLVGEPVRNRDVNDMNSVATAFGIVYQDDYLYNVVRNAGNYRDVIIHDFADTALTDGLESVVFFTAHSLRVASGGIAFGDEATYASRSEQPGNQVVVAQTTNGQVLALPDMTFLTSPYNSFASNNRFIDNISDWLVSARRTYILGDHPYFLGPETQIVFDDTFVFNRQIGAALKLRSWLESFGIKADFRDRLNPAQNAITVGLYADIDLDLAYLLQDDGIAVTDLLEPVAPGANPADVPLKASPTPTAAANGPGTPLPTSAPTATPTGEAPPRFVEGQVYLQGVGSFERAGTSLIHLHPQGDAYRLIILASDESALVAGLNTVAGGALAGCLLTDYTALCRGEGGIAPPPTPAPTAAPAVAEVSDVPEILVVSDDDGIPGPRRETGAFEIAAILGARYRVTVWSEDEFGAPLLEDLRARDAVVWATGDYVDIVPSRADAALLAEYVAQGGRLFLAGAHIGEAWGGRDFFRDVAQAEFLGALLLTEVQVAEARHPITVGFEPGQIIALETPAENADIIAPLAPAEAVLLRSPDDEAAGQAALVAGKTRNGRQVYAAFPVELLPADARQTLVLNIAEWLLD